MACWRCRAEALYPLSYDPLCDAVVLYRLGRGMSTAPTPPASGPFPIGEALSLRLRDALGNPYVDVLAAERLVAVNGDLVVGVGDEALPGRLAQGAVFVGGDEAGPE